MLSIADGLTDNDGHEIDERESGGQDIIGLPFENKLHYNAVYNSFLNNGRTQVTTAK